MRLKTIKPRLRVAVAFALGWVFGLSPLMHDNLTRWIFSALLVGLVVAAGMIKE